MIPELNASLRPAGYEVRAGAIHDLETGERLSPASSDGDILRFLVDHCGFGRLDRKRGLRGCPRRDEPLARRVVRAVWAQGRPRSRNAAAAADAASALRDILGDDDDPEALRLVVMAVWNLGWPNDPDDEDCVGEAAEAVRDLVEELDDVR